MSKKPPALNEVFLVQNKNIINVGTAYGRKPVVKETPGSKSTLAGRVFQKRQRRVTESLKPELKKVVQKYVARIMDAVPEADDRPVLLPDHTEIEKILTDFAHEMEGAEGEDPKELDAGGPPAGSTGQK